MIDDEDRCGNWQLASMRASKRSESWHEKTTSCWQWAPLILWRCCTGALLSLEHRSRCMPLHVQPQLSALSHKGVTKLEAGRALLLSTPGMAGASARRKTAEPMDADQPAGAKRRRKRKLRLPQGFDPANPGPKPDPERWLPKWQRQGAKRKRLRSKDKVSRWGSSCAIFWIWQCRWARCCGAAAGGVVCLCGRP